MRLLIFFNTQHFLVLKSVVLAFYPTEGSVLFLVVCVLFYAKNTKKVWTAHLLILSARLLFTANALVNALRLTHTIFIWNGFRLDALYER